MTVAMTGVHRGRFGAAMDEFRRRRGAEPDRAWRALVLLTTSIPGFWERVREHIDWDELSLDPAAIPVASYDEVSLLRVAANLLQGQDGAITGDAEAGAGTAITSGPETGAGPTITVDVRDMADNMDGALWRVVMLAWEEYQKRV